MTFKVAPPPNIRLEIAAALLTAGRAESAYAEGNSREAQTLCDEAERRVRTTLRHICELTEGEADAIEPAFSELEKRLFRVRSRSFSWMSPPAAPPGFDDGGKAR